MRDGNSFERINFKIRLHIKLINLLVFNFESVGDIYLIYARSSLVVKFVRSIVQYDIKIDKCIKFKFNCHSFNKLVYV